MPSLARSPKETVGDLLVPRLDLSVAPPDPMAIATWHLAISNLIGVDIPHQLFGLWVFPRDGGAVLLGPEALADDQLDLPEPDPFLGQDELFELEEMLRRATYASAVALPIRGTDRDVGLALIGTFEAGAYGAPEVRRLQDLAARLLSTLEPLSHLLRGQPQGRDSAIAPLVDEERVAEAVSRVVVEAPTGAELVRRLSGLLHAHLPHDRLELIAYANGSRAAIPLSGATPRRRWGASAHTWGDLVRLLEDLMGTGATVTVADLNAEAPGLAWPSDGRGPLKIASLLAARLVLAEQPVGLLILGHVAHDVYRPTDEDLALVVARLASAAVAALRLEGEVQALRGQLEVLQAPSLPVLRAAEALGATAHLGEALHRFGAEVAEVIPHERIRYLLRWSEHDVVTLSADSIRPLPDLPVSPIDVLTARPVLDGDRPWHLSQGDAGPELAVPLRVADRRVGAMVIEAPDFTSPRDAAAAAQQFAAVIAPHLELVRRSATSSLRSSRQAGESVPRPGG